MTVSYRVPVLADAQALATMARSAFEHTFAAHFPAEPMARYLDDAYGPAGAVARDLLDPTVSWQIAEADGKIVGYAKLVPLESPAPDPLPGALELKQLYLEAGRKGQGIADALMDWALDTSRIRGAPQIYLAVFDWNARACAFYTRRGFAQVATFDFDLGGMAARDTIWQLAL